MKPYSPQSTVSMRVTYTLTPGAAAGVAANASRYKLACFVAVSNLTNRPNYSGFSG